MKIPKRTVSIGGELFEVPDLVSIFGKGLWGIILVVAVIWALSGFYIVRPDQQGVIRRFGKYIAKTSPGIHWHIPYPVEKVDRPRVEQVKRVEIGFRTVDPGPPARYSDRPNESLMLTGGLNIINCDVIVQYKIIEAEDYLFKVRDQENTIRFASEAALRQVIGKHNIDEALTTGKSQIQSETRSQIQSILDRYQAGILVKAVQLQDVHPPAAVVDAFKDVASAREDLNRLINQAEGYRNDVIPRTRGEAEKLVKEAEAWAAERITKAEGDAENFTRILNEYRKAREVTRRRMFLETMEQILPGVRKYILRTSEKSSLMNVLGLPGWVEPPKGGAR